MKLQIMKYWKVYFLLVCVIASIAVIIPTPQSGVVVKSISRDSPMLGKVTVGESINWANEKSIDTAQDFYAFDNFTGVLRFMHNGKLDLADISTPGLKMVVDEKPAGKMNLGLDLMGGTRVILKAVEENVSEEVMQQAISTLETRINTYGLKESKFQLVKDVSGNSYIQIEMAGGSQAEVEELLAKQGKFEGKIPKVVKIEDGKGTLNLGGKSYDVSYSGGDVTVDGKTLGINGTSVLDGVNYSFANYTDGSAVLMFTVFTGDDVKSVCIQDQPGICASRLVQAQGGYEFMFQVILSQESADKFAKVTQGMATLVNPNSGEAYLESSLILFMDDISITDLTISADLAGKALTEPSITGGAATRDEARKEKLKLQSILESGELPAKMEIVRIDQISATLGQGFVSSAIMSGILAALMVGGVIFLRYRNWKISVPVILTSFSEVVIILGMATVIGWTIDLSAIVGVIATVGTGVDSQIMIIDELGRKEQKLYTLKQKIGKAFFMIFGSASTVIAAMLPMLFIGIGVMKGFAIVTSIGVLIGVFITRPAFSVIAEKIIEKEELKASAVKAPQ